MMLACAAAPATGGAPSWVHRGGGAYDAPNGKGFYAVGIGTSKDKIMRRTQSHNEAFKEMASIFGKHVTNLYKSSRESVTDTENENVEAYTADITKSLVDVKLVGVNIINHYEGKDGTLYSLAYLNLDAFGDNLQKMNELDKRAAAAIRARAESNFEDLNAELEKARGN
tara:strand:+ start:3155 stop:3661 length:507 start_codon:yes stop_codon:yes gene_type:complete